MKQATKLLRGEWDLGHKDSGAPNSLCAWLYLFGILECTDEMIVYRKDGRLMGFAGYGAYDGDSHRYRKRFYRFLQKLIYLSPSIKDKDALKEYNHAYDQIIESVKNDFDSELSILIIDKSLRGQGIGKKLLYDIWEKARQQGMKHMLISTDDSCSYYIYEATGCHLILRHPVCIGEYDESGCNPREYSYIYEKYL